MALFLTRNLETGGAERVFVNLVNNARDVSPAVALLERRGGLLSALRSDVPVFARAISNAAFPGAQFTRLIPECRWLRDVVLEARANVVSSFLMRAHIVALLTKRLYLPRLHVVLNMHEHMSGSADYLYPGAVDRVLMRWITRHLFPEANRIVAVANDVRRDLVETFGVPSSLVDVVHNGVDLDAVRAGAQDAPPATQTSPTIVAVGRLVPLKGYDLLLRAVRQLRERRDVRVILVGDGDARASLERLARELGLSNVVTFAGWQKNPWALVARADVLALTSRTEAFPCVLTEAMALGVPVLATNCSGGVEEALAGGDAGMLVPSGDVHAIANGLESLIGDADLRARYVAAGLARAASFDLTRAQRRYESVLLDTIAPRTT